MADDAISEHVFLDAEVFVRFGFKYSSTPFKSLIDLIAKGRLKLVITDIVIKEVDAQIEKAVRAVGAAHKRFSKEGRVLGSSGVEGVAAKVEKFDEDAVIDDLKEKFHQFLADNKAVTIATNEVALNDVMDDYFAGKPPFDTGDKKAEFPDAITVKALADWGESEGAQILVVSGDKGVCKACEPVEWLIENETVQEMLNDVADDNEKLANFIRAQVHEREEDIARQAIEEFQDRYFFVIDENGDADVTVEKAIVLEVDILEIRDEEATVEVSYRVEYEANVTYDDTDMVSYDSETGESFSWGTREDTVHRVTFARAEVGVLFDGLDPDSFDINYVIVTEPSDSFGVPLYDPRDDK